MTGNETNLKDFQENWLSKIGLFPFFMLALGLGSVLAGIAIIVLPNIHPQSSEKLEAASRSGLIPALLIAIGVILIFLFFLFREIRVVERKIISTTDNAFDREVAALLAALRPFAERLEERIGPVLTAAQKLVKPLDSLHQDLQKQGQKIEEIGNSFEETKLLLARCREDFTVLGRGGKSTEALEKQIEALAHMIEAQKDSTQHLEPIRKSLQESTAQIQHQYQEVVASLQPLAQKTENLAAAQKQMEELIKKLPAEKGPAISLEPLQKAIADSIQKLDQKQEDLAKAFTGLKEEERSQIEKLREEISKSQKIAHQALEAATAAASASQKAAETLENSVGLFEKIEAASRNMPAPASQPAEKPTTFDTATAASDKAEEEEKKAELASSSPQEKRSIKDAIAKLRNLRGGS